MISYIRGTLAEVIEDVIVVETGGVGINIHVPLTVTERLPRIGEEILIYTYLKVAEDSLTLFGFETRRDLDMFRRLISVNGIGPRGALAILSTLAPEDLRMAIIAGDAKSISRAPGIGAKTAQRVILDLREKVTADDLSFNVSAAERAAAAGRGASSGAEKSAAGEAMEALIQLGYSATEAGRAVRAVENAEGMDSEALLKGALRQFRF